VVFCKPVAVAAAVVRRDGRVQAAGHPADHARLGLAEERLDALTGRPDVIGQIAAAVTLTGKVKGAARRAMTPALAIRLVLLMTLLAADYAEVMAALIGDLAAVPWQRRYALPTATVASTWREAIGPGPLQELRDLLLAAIDAEHQAGDYRAVQVGDLDACSIDGSLTRVPDTPANRQAFGSAGTADDSSPYPQLRELRLSHASTRAALAVTCGPLRRRGRRRKGEGRSGAEAAGQGPAALPAPVHQRPDVDHGPEFSGSSPHPADARDRHARADPRQGRHHPDASRRLQARRLLPGHLVRRRRHPHRPRDRVSRHRRRAGRPGAVLPDH
jgi:hypothetical protein